MTFLFTDIEGSTSAWIRNPIAMRDALARHDALIESVVASCGGSVVRPRGEGDSRFVVFARATDALAAASAVQVALVHEHWPPEAQLHTGENSLSTRGPLTGLVYSLSSSVRPNAPAVATIRSTTRTVGRRAVTSAIVGA